MSSGAAVFVLGPAGSGKSSFCASLMDYCKVINRPSHLINLDPGAEDFIHDPSIDVRNLVNVLDVMEEYGLGPNGAQIFCYEYLVSNLTWLEEEIGDNYTDEFLIIDCPGQIEIYTHMTLMSDVIQIFERRGYRPLALYLVESQYTMEIGKYYGATLSAISCMLRLGIPHLNIMSKIDLVRKSPEDEIPGEEEEGIDENHELFRYLNPDKFLINEMVSSNQKYRELTEAIVQLIDEFDMVSYLCFSTKSEKLMEDIVLHIDNATQYSEGLEPKENNGRDHDDYSYGGELEERYSNDFNDLD